MTTRVDQIALYIRKLTQATGVETENREGERSTAASASRQLDQDPSLFFSMSTVTSDLDIEALTKGLLDISRDLDLYLQSLLEQPELPVAKLKSDIAKLETELKEKDEELEKATEMVRTAEAVFRKLKTRQLRNLYHF